MRKSLFILVIALISIVAICSCSFAASKFSDVNGTKYEVAVTNLNTKGIIDGYTDGTFKPMSNVTRAQLCKLLVEGLGLKKANNVVKKEITDNNKGFPFGAIIIVLVFLLAVCVIILCLLNML